jgi:hypothetical protein
MKLKTSELHGAALDWAVAKCENEEVSLVKGQLETRWTENGWSPSSNWAQGGPIIEREWVSVEKRDNELHWSATLRFANGNRTRERGPTPLIAAMRCYVMSQLGDEVEIPDELTDTNV